MPAENKIYLTVLRLVNCLIWTCYIYFSVTLNIALPNSLISSTTNNYTNIQSVTLVPAVKLEPSSARLSSTFLIQHMDAYVFVFPIFLHFLRTTPSEVFIIFMSSLPAGCNFRTGFGIITFIIVIYIHGLFHRHAS